MSKLDLAEITHAFADPETARRFPPFLTEAQAAELLHQAPKTIGNWRRDGKLEGTYSKEGKSVLYIRHRLVARFLPNTINDWKP